MSKEVPDVIWLDARLAHTWKTEPDDDLEGFGVPQIGYMKITKAQEDKRRALADLSANIPAEFIVQIAVSSSEIGHLPLVLALTNHGRLFQQVGATDWIPFPGPDLGPNGRMS